MIGEGCESGAGTENFPFDWAPHVFVNPNLTKLRSLCLFALVSKCYYRQRIHPPASRPTYPLARCRIHP